jgi:hypothetical protein
MHLVTMNEDLLRAMKKRLVEFVYKAGRSRIVEPHDYGILAGVESLFGLHVAGESRSGTSDGWRHFGVDGMHQLRVLDRHFAGTRANSHQRQKKWDVLFARAS